MSKQLTKRMSTIRNLYQNEKNIWDLCCDHGKIGLSFEESNAEEIHFVDIVPSIIQELKNKHGHTSTKFYFHAVDAKKLKTNSKPSNLVIIAGVGGMAAIEILTAILPKFDKESLSLILSVHRDQVELRSFLNKNLLKLDYETVIEDKNHFYEIMRLGPNGKLPIHILGHYLWQEDNPDRYNYLKHLNKYYHKISQHHEIKEITDYLQLLSTKLGIDTDLGLE